MSTIQPERLTSLMQLKPTEWASRSDNFLNARIASYLRTCVPSGGSSKKALFEKHDLAPGSSLAVIGDLHGQDLRLDLTLKTLQKRNFLDENFCVQPGKKIIFLGDFVDKGPNSLKVLELVLALKLENKESVHLLRGNHEDVDQTAPRDVRYRSYLSDKSNEYIMRAFYKSLPVTHYIGEKSKSGKREYVCFTHAMFHLYTDPAPLLKKKTPDAHLWVKDSDKFSPRIEQIQKTGSEKLKSAVSKLKSLASQMKVQFEDIFWLDVGQTVHYNAASGRCQLSPDFIKAHLQVSGLPEAKIKELFRGHQATVLTWMSPKHRPIVTTLDPSRFAYQTFMEIQIAEQVKDWKREHVSFPLNSQH